MQIGGRVAIVTGAASGIGRATAVALAQAGAAAVALADVDEAGLAETAAAVQDAGVEALRAPTDVRDPGALSRLYARTAEELGDFTILHNNAGLPTGTPTWPDLSVGRIVALCDVNLKAVILGTHLALEPMRAAGGGAIVNTASIAAHMPLPPEAVYAATKAGVVMFTRSCAPLAESHGVRVACVCPGVVETPMLRKTGVGGELAEYLAEIHASIEPLAPERIAEAVVALVLDDGSAARVVDVPNEPRKEARA